MLLVNSNASAFGNLNLINERNERDFEMIEQKTIQLKYTLDVNVFLLKAEISLNVQPVGIMILQIIIELHT